MTETQKIALVTGASRGLGAALAEELAGGFTVRRAETSKSFRIIEVHRAG